MAGMRVLGGIGTVGIALALLVGTATPAGAASVRTDPDAPSGQCADSVLKVAVVQQPKDSGAGQRYAHVDFTNTGTTTCRLRGAPGVSLVGHGNGTQLGRPADREQTGTPVTVQLAPGQHASAALHYAAVDSGGGPYGAACTAQKADGYRIYPPHSYRSWYVKSPQWACTSTAVHWGDVAYVDTAYTAATSSTAGCRNDASVPAGATVSAIEDVDRDGRTDAQFSGVQDGRLVYGIRTAAGGVYRIVDGLPGGGTHGGWTAVLDGAGVVSVIDDGHTADLFAFRHCRFVQPQHRNGGAYVFGLAGTSKAGTGVACNDQNGGPLLIRANAVRRSDGRYDVRWTVVRVSDDGRTAYQETGPGTTSVRYSDLKASDPRVVRAMGSFCSLVPKVEASAE